MTRQSRARWLAFATAALVVLLAAAFAWLRNLAPAGHADTASAAIAVDRELLEGRAAFERMGCSGCHSLEGRGNPTLPLDGVGSRLDGKQLRDAAFALGETGIRLPAAVAARKRGHDADADAETVISYLQKSR